MDTNSNIQRRRVVVGLAAGMALAGMDLHAQEAYPSKPIHLIVASAPGAINDAIARLVSDRIQPMLGQPVVVEFKPGAGQQIATEYVNRAAPDGHTILLVTSGITALADVNKAFKLDILKDLSPVTLVASAPLLLVTNPRFNSVKELVEFGRRGGNRINAGVSAATDLLASSVFASATGFNQEIVRFAGAGPVLQSLAAGDLHYALVALGSAKGLLDAGRINVVAVTGSERFPAVPNAPTMAELGYPQVGHGFWIGLLAPPRTPQPIVDKVATAVTQAVRSADLHKRIADVGMRAKGSTPAEFTQVLQNDLAENARTIREYNIKFQ